MGGKDDAGDRPYGRYSSGSNELELAVSRHALRPESVAIQVAHSPMMTLPAQSVATRTVQSPPGARSHLT